MTVVTKCLAVQYITGSISLAVGCPGILVVWFKYAVREKGREREKVRGTEREREREFTCIIHLHTHPHFAARSKCAVHVLHTCLFTL